MPRRRARLGATLDTPGDARRVKVSGYHAYVADDEGGLQVIDVRSQGHPWTVGGTALFERAVDVALSESIFNMLEGMLPEFDVGGVIRERSGTSLPGVAPTNTYRCNDGRFIVIGANGDSIFKRLMLAMSRPDLAEDPRLAENQGRVTHQQELDDAITAWTSSVSSEEALHVLDGADVPAGPIYNAADMLADPHYNAREMFHQVEIDGKPLKIPAMTPKLDSTPGRTRWSGPQVGAHNQEILGTLLGLDATALANLKERGVI